MHTYTHAHPQHSGRRPARGRIRDGRTTLLLATAAAAAAATTTVIGPHGMTAAAAAAAFLPPFQPHRAYSASRPPSLGRKRSSSSGSSGKPNSLVSRRPRPPAAVGGAATSSGGDGDGGSSRISRARKGGAVAPLPGQAHAVVFVRHGQSDFNRFELFTGWCDVDINDVVRFGVAWGRVGWWGRGSTDGLTTKHSPYSYTYTPTH